MRNRSASRAPKFKPQARVNLDPRSPAERRIAELMLGMILGRSRPQMYGDRGQQLLDETANEKLPWEFYDD